MFKKIKPYIFSVLIPLAVGGISALLTKDAVELFSYKIQPPLSPPSWLFPIVWTILYILMGIGSGIVYVNRKNNPDASASALRVYALQLAVNFLWSIIFFNFEAYLFAFIWIILLLVLIAVMISRFGKISRLAAILQIPYFLWVSFAAYLNFAVWLLNR